jgi:hypothetical protein
MDLGKLVSTLLLGALAIGGCEGSSGSSGRCNEGREWSEEEKSCVEYSDASQPGDALEDSVCSDPNVVMCDDFSDLERTESMWETWVGEESEGYRIQNGYLQPNVSSFWSLETFTTDTKYTLEFRFRITDKESAGLGELNVDIYNKSDSEGKKNVYCSLGVRDGNTTINVIYGGNMSAKIANPVESTDTKVGAWHVVKISIDQSLITASVNGDEFFRDNGLPVEPQEMYFIFGGETKGEMDYIKLE